MKTLQQHLDQFSYEITRADRKASLNKYYNPHALGLMLQAHERLTQAVANAAYLDSDADKGSARMLVHQICQHFTNTPPALKAVKAIAKEYKLTTEAWAGYRDSIVFVEGVAQKS